MDKLIDIVNRAVEDYGFRQVAQWSPGDLAEQWQLSAREEEVLKGLLKNELDRLPIPVEPQDYVREEKRLAEIIKAALG